MNKAILFLFACFLSVASVAQGGSKSKIYLKNGNVLTARIVSYKPQESFTIEISINAVVDIPFNDIDYIVLDANNNNTSKPVGLTAEDMKTFPLPQSLIKRQLQIARHSAEYTPQMVLVTRIGRSQELVLEPWDIQTISDSLFRSCLIFARD